MSQGYKDPSRSRCWYPRLLAQDSCTLLCAGKGTINPKSHRSNGILQEGTVPALSTNFRFPCKCNADDTQESAF